MASVDTIRNNTGNHLRLYDAAPPAPPAVTLAQGQAVHSVTLLILRVACNGTMFATKAGAFVDREAYEATHRAAGGGLAEAIVFTGQATNVVFTP